MDFEVENTFVIFVKMEGEVPEKRDMKKLREEFTFESELDSDEELKLCVTEEDWLLDPEELAALSAQKSPLEPIQQNEETFSKTKKSSHRKMVQKGLLKEIARLQQGSSRPSRLRGSRGKDTRSGGSKENRQDNRPLKLQLKNMLPQKPQVRLTRICVPTNLTSKK